MQNLSEGGELGGGGGGQMFKDDWLFANFGLQDL